jgi:hypothetical protein
MMGLKRQMTPVHFVASCCFLSIIRLSADVGFGASALERSPERLTRIVYS